MPKLGQCTVCLHRKASAINRALIAGEMNLSKISKSFRVPYQSLYRHRLKHLPTELVKRKEETVQDAAQSLVSELEALVEKTEAIRSRAMAPKTYDGELALKALSQRARQIELKARLLGQLEERNPSPSRVEVVYIDKMLVAGNSLPSRPALPAASINNGEE